MARMDRQTAERVLRRDQELNRRFPAKPGGPLRMSISPEAVANAIATEGPEVMSEAGKGYWDDMRKMYPHLDMQPDTGGADSPKTRYGKATLRMRGGIWYRRVDGQWKPLHDAGLPQTGNREGGKDGAKASAPVRTGITSGNQEIRKGGAKASAPVRAGIQSGNREER